MDILDDVKFSIEERLQMAKELLAIKDTQIKKLEDNLDKLRTEHSWTIDQNGYHRMGL